MQFSLEVFVKSVKIPKKSKGTSQNITEHLFSRQNIAFCAVAGQTT